MLCRLRLGLSSARSIQRPAKGKTLALRWVFFQQFAPNTGEFVGLQTWQIWFGRFSLISGGRLIQNLGCADIFSHLPGTS